MERLWGPQTGGSWPLWLVCVSFSSTLQPGEEMEACEELALALSRGLQLDTQRSSRDSLQCSSGYSTQTTTPCCSEDTIPSQGTRQPGGRLGFLSGCRVRRSGGSPGWQGRDSGRLCGRSGRPGQQTASEPFPPSWNAAESRPALVRSLPSEEVTGTFATSHFPPSVAGCLPV